MERTDDDLLREASDPTTPGERLRALVEEGSKRTRRERHLRSPGLRAAVVGNPSIPLPLLRQALQAGPEDRCWREAWHNPTTPLLLLTEPRAEYELAACRLLRALCDLEGPEGYRATEHVETLSGFVVLLAQSRWSDTTEQAFARHLARLFGLPWPDP